MSLAIYNRIQLLRTERGLSRKALAEALQVNYQTVGYLERGDYNPSLEMALRIAAYFELPVEMIFSLAPFPSLSDQLKAAQAPIDPPLPDATPSNLKNNTKS